MIKIIDRIMGSGKSTEMIETINNSDPSTRWVVVAPFLKECHRYAGTEYTYDKKREVVPVFDADNNFVYNGTGCNLSGRRFKHPRKLYGSKVKGISSLVDKGEDIVTTHAALQNFTNDNLVTLSSAGYKLVVDEALEVISPLSTPPTIQQILLNKALKINPDNNSLVWIEQKDEDSLDPIKYDWYWKAKRLCETGSLVLLTTEEQDENNAVAENGQPLSGIFVFEYPKKFISVFEDVFVLTHRFEHSIMKHYLDINNLDYSIDKKEITSSPNIEIVDNDRMNKIGRMYNSFSASWQRNAFKRKDYALSRDMRNNLKNFFNNAGTYGKSTAKQRMWTCLSEVRGKIKGKGYTKQHVPFNLKAVNNYCDVSHLAYCYSEYLNPTVYNYLLKRGVREEDINVEQIALNTLLQWVYRSRVRKGGEIALYLPSRRMRSMLVNWLKSSEEKYP